MTTVAVIFISLSPNKRHYVATSSIGLSPITKTCYE